MTEHRPGAATRAKLATQEESLSSPTTLVERSVTEATLAALLGVHLAEVDARLNAWGEELRRGVMTAVPADAHAARGIVEAQSPEAVAAGPTRPGLALKPLASHRPAAGWEGWSHHQSIEMRADGIVELKQARSTPGIVSHYMPAPQERLLCLRVTIDIPDPAEDPQPALRVVNEAGDPLGPDFPCAVGTFDHFIFLPTRTQRLRFYIIALKPKEGRRFAVREVDVLAVDTDSFQAQVRHDLDAPVIASMASIPQRRPMLADAVASLLLQCDRVRVFLNNYPDVPDFLNHPRIDVRRSQDWDDKGDAGKFGWIDVLEEPGYRIIVDDDLIFPPDFARESVAGLRRYGNHAFVALHGVLLRQPVSRYYDPASRNAFHFANALTRDRTVHVLGTNAFCYHSPLLKLRWSDFAHRNMADIFVAEYAQRHAIPMIALARPRNWVLQNKLEGGFETIYDNSLKGTRSRFDSSLVQDALVKHAWPVTAQPTMRPKVVFCLLAMSQPTAKAALDAWQSNAWAEYDWALIICQITQDPALRAWIDELRVPYELHILNQVHESPKARLASAIALAQRLGSQLVCLSTCELRVVSGQWTHAVLGVLNRYQGAALFGHRGADDRLQLGRDAVGPDGAIPALAIAPTALMVSAGDADQRQQDVFAVIAEWMARLALAQSASASGNLSTLPDVSKALRCSPEHRFPVVRLPEAVELQSKVGWRRIPPAPAATRTLNDVFQRICVINLDRRPDRWGPMRRRLERAGIRADRVSAVDGQLPEVKAEFEAYEAQPLVPPPTGVRQVGSSWQFYRDYDSQTARLAFEEGRVKRKAIASAGAWAYLATWQNIIERALEDQVESLLVFDDDVAFHGNVNELFTAAHRELPADWLVLQLGTLQYNWDREAVTQAGRHLYRTDGSAIGSHAVGLRFEILPYLLELVKRRDMPFDVGPLAAATLAFKDRSFVVWPNAAIQFLHDSDIGTSDFQKSRTLETASRTYRWYLPDYDL